MDVDGIVKKMKMRGARPGLPPMLEDVIIIADKVVAGRKPGPLIHIGATLFNMRDEDFLRHEVERISNIVYEEMMEIKRRGGTLPPPEQIEKMLDEKMHIFFM